MTLLRRFSLAVFTPLLIVLLFSAAGVRGQTMGDPEEFTAFAVNMGSLVSGTTASLIITVNRWSTQAERDKVLGTLREKGPDALLDLLRDAPRLGSLRTPSTVGYELRYAQQEPGKDGGRRVLIITDRPIGFYEATNRPPTFDYPFSVIDMQLGTDGKGEGTLSLAARIIPAGKNIVVENYDTAPIKLNRIETRKLTKR